MYDALCGPVIFPMQYAHRMIAFIVIRFVCPAVTAVSHPRVSTNPVEPSYHIINILILEMSLVPTPVIQILQSSPILLSQGKALIRIDPL